MVINANNLETPSIARLADDRAAQQDPHDVDGKLIEWLKHDRARGEFAAVHIAPDGASDVPDEMEARLVVLGPEYPHVTRADDSRAIKAEEETLNSRGAGQRLYKNMLVFAAADAKALPNLQQAMRLLMAWTSIVDAHEALNLDPVHRKQAESKKKELEGTVEARMQETWIWALVPGQSDPRGREMEWEVSRLQGQDELALRASKKLMHDDALLTRMGPVRLKLELDKHLWTDVDHLNTRKLWEWMASYLYLPRLKNSDVLLEAIQGGVGELVCDNFAYAGCYNEETRRYEGLILTGGGMVVIDDLSVVIKPDVARVQQAAETEAPDDEKEPTGGGAGGEGSEGTDTEGEGAVTLPRRFFATVEVDADRAARDVGKIAEEVLQHLTVLPNRDRSRSSGRRRRGHPARRHRELSDP